MKEQSPVFIKLEDYREILDLVDGLKQQLVSVHATFDEIQQLRDQEQAEIDAWNKNLVSVEKQLEQIDATLFEPEE